ncbi:hypothetical protein POM88_024620 [Heracleum sosnowskyi]|uniref:Uncharacterized protein n=1 Tax=Heracleum sosnowskyi TaxID=360622 RepID=A0AAD8I3D6_9APIA|nr:hypothetical protein POM88_024620 [Heracleum sosnowskyi]
MNAFSSPLESVAFDFILSDISTIFVSNLWTWMAVFCAGAASLFWRGAKSPLTLQIASTEPDIPVANSLNPSSLVSASSEPEMHKVVSSKRGYELRFKDTTILDNSDGVTKGKFVAYYYPEESENECNDEHYEIGNGEGEAHAELLRWFKVDKLERMKEINECGLYCCQDLTVFSGDIVRLWDDRS